MVNVLSILIFNQIQICILILSFFLLNIVFEFNENDSLAYKTKFYDFRGEKGRDKTKDVSPLSFAMRNYKPAG